MVLTMESKLVDIGIRSTKRQIVVSSEGSSLRITTALRRFSEGAMHVGERFGEQIFFFG